MVLPICASIRSRSASVKPVAFTRPGVPKAKPAPYPILRTLTGNAGRPNLRLSSLASTGNHQEHQQLELAGQERQGQPHRGRAVGTHPRRLEDQASGAVHVDPGTRDHVYNRAEAETLIAMTRHPCCASHPDSWFRRRDYPRAPAQFRAPMPASLERSDAQRQPRLWPSSGLALRFLSTYMSVHLHARIELDDRSRLFWGVPSAESRATYDPG